MKVDRRRSGSSSDLVGACSRKETDTLLRKYWNIPEQQIETSVVLKLKRQQLSPYLNLRKAKARFHNSHIIAEKKKRTCLAS
jgi:hypothetical protein